MIRGGAVTASSDHLTNHQTGTGLPSNAWICRRLAIGLAPPLAALVLLLAGAQVAAAVLLLVGAAIASQCLGLPMLVLAERARQRDAAKAVSR